MIASPQTAIAPRTTAPCRSTRVTQPDDRPITSAPIEMPANSQPRLLGDSANRVCDSSGKTACGQANSHRDDVDDEGHEQHRLGAQEGEALAHPAHGGTDPQPLDGAARAATAAARAAAVAATRKPTRVDGVGQEQVAQPDEHPGQQRPDDDAGLPHRHRQRVGRGHPRRADERRDDGARGSAG